MMKPIATIKIKDADKLTPRQRVEMAEWFKRHAADIIRDGPNYSKNFTGKYMG